MIKRLRITINGEPYEVTAEILDEPSAVPAAGSLPVASVSAPVVVTPPRAPSAISGSGTVTSPMSGKFVSCAVKVGDEVSIGDVLATVEAMKMNTYVHAECGGRVLEILATPGDGVEEGQVLLRIG